MALPFLKADPVFIVTDILIFVIVNQGIVGCVPLLALLGLFTADWNDRFPWLFIFFN